MWDIPRACVLVCVCVTVTIWPTSTLSLTTIWIIPHCVSMCLCLCIEWIESNSEYELKEMRKKGITKYNLHFSTSVGNVWPWKKLELCEKGKNNSHTHTQKSYYLCLCWLWTVNVTHQNRYIKCGAILCFSFCFLLHIFCPTFELYIQWDLIWLYLS